MSKMSNNQIEIPILQHVLLMAGLKFSENETGFLSKRMNVRVAILYHNQAIESYAWDLFKIYLCFLEETNKKNSFETLFGFVNDYCLYNCKRDLKNIRIKSIPECIDELCCRESEASSAHKTVLASKIASSFCSKVKLFTTVLTEDAIEYLKKVDLFNGLSELLEDYDGV